MKFRSTFRNDYDKKHLKNKDFTILCSNCIGGVISHDLGLPFLSPTVNLYIQPHDFIKLLDRLPHYLEQDFKEIDSPYGYPMGILEDIVFYFKHYATFDEAVAKWHERKKRINYDNLFIMMTDRFFLSYSDALTYDNLPYDNKILLMSNKKNWPEVKCAIPLRHWNDDRTGSVGVITDTVSAFGKHMYQQSGFDYLSWLNDPKEFWDRYRRIAR
jgi:uncharacterized protein (DUF1919 family)